MASKRRLRRKACQGKARHSTMDGAQIALRRLVKAAGGRVGMLSAYSCPHCGGFHVGHTPGRNGVGSAWR